MEMVLRTPCRELIVSENGAVRHLGSTLQGHKAARLPRQPEKVRRMSFGQQRALGAVDAICCISRYCSGPLRSLNTHIACIRFHLRTRCRFTFWI